MYKKLKLVESASDRYQVREFDGPGAKFGVYDTKEKKFVQKGSKKVMTAACEDLNKKKSLKEDSTEEYWDATEIARDGFMSLMKFNFGTDFKGNNYIITIDANDIIRFRADNDDEAIEKYNKFKEEWNNSDHGDLTTDIKPIAPRNESALTEAEDDEELEDIKDDVKEDLENQEELEDTIDSEEDQEENPVEEESELDTKLNELRDILVDLDLNLYQITDKEDLNNSVYIIGKVAEDSDDVLMLVDTKPEEVNSEEVPEEEPIIDKIDTDNDLEESALKESKENKLTWEQFEEAMTNASKEGKNIKGVIVFKPESFDKEYSEESRSYEVSSDNKYWDGSKLGSSLFGYCLDGTDQGARLDWYMKAVPEDGLGKRWIVDYCYLEDDTINEAEDIEIPKETEEDEHKTELEQRFDFVKLPNSFEELNKLNPRYGEELTPDHESIVEYLMNCLIEKNPEAAEELQNNEETPIESNEDIDLNIDINGEEDLNNED